MRTRNIVPARLGRAVAAGLGALGMTAVLVLGSTGPAAAADLDGAFNVGEFVIWEHNNQTGNIWDTTASYKLNYSGIRFVNSNLGINDRASSSANGFNQRTYAYEHPNCDGASITHLPYGQTTSSSVGWSYISLGWANDRYSGHDYLTSC